MSRKDRTPSYESVASCVKNGVFVDLDQDGPNDARAQLPLSRMERRSPYKEPIILALPFLVAFGQVLRGNGKTVRGGAHDE